MVWTGEPIDVALSRWAALPAGRAREGARSAWVVLLKGVVERTLIGFRLPGSESEELVQDVTHRVSVQVEAGAVAYGAVATYARTSATRAAISLKRRKGRGGLELDEEHHSATLWDEGSTSPEDEFLSRERRAQAVNLVSRALAELPASYRSVIEVIDIEGRSRDELARKELVRRVRAGKVRVGQETQELDKCKQKIWADISRARRRFKQVVLRLQAEESSE